MKKLFYLLLVFIISQGISIANYNDIYIVDIQYDWIRKKTIEKEAIISELRDIMFDSPVVKQKGLRKELKDKLKDKNHIEHYMAASAGHKEYGEYNISAFYFKNQKNIYMYAIQDKKDISKAYYYDALGHLKYIDYIYGGYPEYPYYAIQYRVSGNPVSAIYYVSKENQYLFKPNGTFKGVWYKYNLYDEHSKVILKRSAY